MENVRKRTQINFIQGGFPIKWIEIVGRRENNYMLKVTYEDLYVRYFDNVPWTRVVLLHRAAGLPDPKTKVPDDPIRVSDYHDDLTEYPQYEPGREFRSSEYRYER